MFNVGLLNEIRAAELEKLVSFLPPGARLLEFGAGTGEQAKLLSERGFDVIAIDLAGGSYSNERVFPVTDYDGRQIPLPDKSVDVVFSSNVLEHVEDLGSTFAEFRRVLKDGGIGVHAIPTPAWRFWTFVAGVPSAIQAAAVTVPNLISPPAGLTRRGAAVRNLKTIAGGLLPIGHGTSREGISELWTFSSRAWSKTFLRYGWEVVEERPTGLFHTGHLLAGNQFSFAARRKLAGWLGSAAQIYIVRPTAGA